MSERSALNEIILGSANLSLSDMAMISFQKLMQDMKSNISPYSMGTYMFNWICSGNMSICNDLESNDGVP